MKKLISFTLFCLIAVMANAFTLSGHIKTDSLKALPYVSVYLKDVQIGATTDLDGYYKLTDIPAGRHTVIVSYVGYETQAYEMELDADGLHDFVMHEQSISLDDVFVTPTGESIERYILSQVVKHTKKLGQRVNSFDGTTSFRFEQRNNNMKKYVEPYMGAVKLALGLMGYKKIFMCIIDHPDLKIEMLKNTVMKGGKLKADATKVTYCSPKLSSEETEAWEKKGYALSENPYDLHYKALATIKKSLETADKKNPGASVKVFKYGGSFEENNQTIQILKFGGNEYYIVDGTWQIRRVVNVNRKGEKYITEFQQYKKDLYLPVSYYHESIYDFSKLLEEESKAKKEDIKAPKCTTKSSYAFTYKNIVMK